MMKFTQTGREGGDCTTPYNVTNYKSKTVGEFIKEVIAERPCEWGYIYVQRDGEGWLGCPKMEYRYGKELSNLPEDLESLEIEKIDAMGGWTNMDYCCHVKA